MSPKLMLPPIPMLTPISRTTAPWPWLSTIYPPQQFAPPSSSTLPPNPPSIRQSCGQSHARAYLGPGADLRNSLSSIRNFDFSYASRLPQPPHACSLLASAALSWDTGFVGRNAAVMPAFTAPLTVARRMSSPPRLLCDVTAVISADNSPATAPPAI